MSGSQSTSNSKIRSCWSGENEEDLDLQSADLKTTEAEHKSDEVSSRELTVQADTPPSFPLITEQTMSRGQPK